MKPLLPFPFPLNIGTDICQISRIYGIISGSRATRFVNRIFAEEEQRRNHARLQVLERATLLNDHNRFIASDGKDAHDGEIATRDPELWKCATFIAGRFAAKEAAIKAHTYRRLSFHDVVIERRAVEGERLGSGPPIARIKSAEGDAADSSAMVSISHDGDYATAVCLGWDKGVDQGTEGVRSEET